jgi:uncharacterized protein YecT (DUF1311 family)
MLLTLCALSAFGQVRDKCDAASEYAVIEQCGWAESDKLGSQLDLAYKQLYAELERKSADLGALVAAQKAWLQYRDLSCGFWSSRVQYQVPWCLANLTAKRVEELTHMLDCERDGGGKC